MIVRTRKPAFGVRVIEEAGHRCQATPTAREARAPEMP
jgi:hypothetical protein